MAGQVDRFGRPIPAEPGYQVIINSDGEVMQQRKTLFLDDSIVATDDPDSDATRLHGTGGEAGSVTRTINTMADLRGMTANPSGRYETLGRFAVGDGGGWPYDWNASSTDTDDGVLTIKATSRATGRFKAVKPVDGIISALACGPAASDLGSRTKSFDPTGVVVVGAEMARITGLLSLAGWQGLDFNGGVYNMSSGDHRIAPRLKGQGFTIRCTGGAKFQGPAITGSANGLGYYCRGKDESLASYPGQLFTQGYRTQTWTQTLTGGELTMNGIAQVAGAATVPLAVGDTCVLRIGAEKTDAGGWSASQYFAEVETITPTTGNSANVKFRQLLAEKPPVGVGTNPFRIQTQHDLVAIDEYGFQDNLVFDGLILSNIFLTGAYDRFTDFRNCRWTECTLGINTTGSEGIHGSVMFDRATGYDQGGGGFAHYGTPIILQACVGTHFSSIKMFTDCDSAVDCELSCRGTTIGMFDLTWDARLSRTGAVGVIQQTDQNDPVRIEHLMLRGGYGILSVPPHLSIGQYVDFSGSEAAGIGVRANGTDHMTYRNVLYHDRRQWALSAPLAASTTNLIQLPIKGLSRTMRLRPTSLTGIVSAEYIIDGTYHVGMGITHWGANRWAQLDYSTILYGIGPTGQQSIVVSITTDGTVPAGTFVYLQGEAYLPELELTGAPVDTTFPECIGGAGAPTANAEFIGQWYLDSVSSPRKYYRAVTVGTGASDWQAVGSAGGLVAANNLSDVTNAATSRTNLGLLAIASSAVVANLTDAGTWGRTVVQAATQAAGTSLLALSTPSLAGLQSAADKLKEDLQPTRIDLATGTNTATTYTSPTWSAGTYRRLGLKIKGKSTASGGGPQTLTLVGASGTESTTINYTATGSTVAVDTQASMYLGVECASGGRFAVDTELLIPTTDWKQMLGICGSREVSTGYHKVITHHGFKQDSTNAVTGITVLFFAACDYEIELWGYP